ncbi:molybdopterin biosynthesis protein MoeB [Papiliotrema laurentii]|uniref:Molybdopterin biosynthesis protein MoeB n=1 Tax=Papiliotrema laurentii TaxID=5418 RepID=A0AAD9FUI4_PAPLA|nr:molybdopterin biosynthesis protein MoeB [Papiliotrema laurentii]
MASSSSTNNELRPLSLDEYKRYGRQMIMPGWGLPGQIKVKGARVAVVGAGGLGCPCLQYLAGAGVGTIGVVDHDTVDSSNLHRQVLHTSPTVGMNKARSAATAMNA